MLVVVSLLTGQGPTGVETHFNLIMEYAAKSGVKPSLVTPHDEHWLTRKPANGIGRLLKLFNPELAVVWSRMISYRRLKRRLRVLVSQNIGRSITLYAQDPLSVAAALDVREDIYFRVVAVSHFNISEAKEMVVKKLTTEGGLLWRAVMKTERNSMPKLDKVIFVSKYMSRIVNERLPCLSKVPQAVIPNFSSIPVEDNPACRELLLRDLIAIGTLEPRKNQNYLLRVLAVCKEREVIYQLTLVGDGPDRKLLQQLAVDLDIDKQIDFIGFKPKAASLIAKHRVLVHAAEVENMPLTLIESLSYGRPVIAAAVGGVPEIITDGIEGCFWGLDEPEKGADILISVLEDPMQLHKMSRAAKRKFKKYFSPDALSKKWLAAITDS